MDKEIIRKGKYMIGQHDHLTRQLSLIPVDVLGVHVHVIGCGAIGSFAALSLAKMGLTNITLWDHDEVSIENMSNQFFRFSDIGHNKAAVTSVMLEVFAKVKPVAYARKFTEEDASTLKGIVIVAVDDMAARRMIFDSIVGQAFLVDLIIDPRMGAEHYTQYAMNPFDDKDKATYNKTFYSNEDAVQERCTAKSTIYTAMLAGGMIAKTVKNWMLREDYPRTLQWCTKSSTNPMQMYAGNVSGLPLPPTTSTGLEQASDQYPQTMNVLGWTERLA